MVYLKWHPLLFYVTKEEDRQQLSQFLQEILCTLSMYQAPLDSLKAAFTELR